MTEDFDRRVKATFDVIVARSPAIGPAPSPGLFRVADPAGRSRRGWMAAAASVAALGVAGLTWVATTHDGASGPMAIPTSPDESPNAVSVVSEPPEPAFPVATPKAGFPGGPTLFPMLDPAVVSGAPLTGVLDYDWAWVKPRSDAVVARIDDDGSTTDLYRFMAGPGVSGYTDAMGGVSIDASTPQVGRLVDAVGGGFAGWTIDGIPVLVVAADPTVLLDDAGFSLTVGADEDGDATLGFDSLPPGFEVLVEPHRFAREAADALLLIGSPSDPPVGYVVTSLNNPLTNLHLTDGGTITPADVGGFDAWIVSVSASGASRAVVWSPDRNTWAAVYWSGSQEDLLNLANAVTFTDSAGEWMTRYGVDLPPVLFDETSAVG